MDCAWCCSTSLPSPPPPCRLQPAGEGPLEDDAGGAGGEHSSRMRYRPMLTQENVQRLAKLDQYSARPDPTGERGG